MLIFSLDTKKCMNALLLHPAFDSFLFIEGDITTFNTFQNFTQPQTESRTSQKSVAPSCPMPAPVICPA